MKRCFVALRVDSRAQDRIGALQKELARIPRESARVRPVSRDNLHLTVKFLGQLTDRQIHALEKALRNIASETPAPHGTLGGVDGFPTSMRPRALFAAVRRGREGLLSLSANVDMVCEELGYEPERRQRVPHVTIARVSDVQTNGPVTDFVMRHTTTPIGMVDATRLILFESHSDSSRSGYQPLFELGFNP